MSSREQSQFLATWEQETHATMKLLNALPADQYDFAPDPGGRTLGQLAWHLAEIDGFISDGVVCGKFDFAKKLPGLERPKTIAALAPTYMRVHGEAVARVAEMKPEAFDGMVPFMGRDMRAGDLLWFVLLHHLIHHRGQLATYVRLAGGVTPGLYGPNREDMAAMRQGS